jgi:hypothetical protein
VCAFCLDEKGNEASKNEMCLTFQDKFLKGIAEFALEIKSMVN